MLYFNNFLQEKGLSTETELLIKSQNDKFLEFAYSLILDGFNHEMNKHIMVNFAHNYGKDNIENRCMQACGFYKILQTINNKDLETYLSNFSLENLNFEIMYDKITLKHEEKIELTKSEVPFLLMLSDLKRVRGRKFIKPIIEKYNDEFVTILYNSFEDNIDIENLNLEEKFKAEDEKKERLRKHFINEVNTSYKSNFEYVKKLFQLECFHSSSAHPTRHLFTTISSYLGFNFRDEYLEILEDYFPKGQLVYNSLFI
ncbi:MAG: hypothetical protein FWF50_02450 [Defluviitaleaceae bacterium]|nr:hypothetical protein [Defluviitaleaceae bacterium]